MHQRTVEEIRHRRETDMRMRSYVDALAGRNVRRPEVVEKDERADCLARAGGQDAADGESAAEIPQMGRKNFDGHRKPARAVYCTARPPGLREWPSQPGRRIIRAIALAPILEGAPQ